MATSDFGLLRAMIKRRVNQSFFCVYPSLSSQPYRVVCDVLGVTTAEEKR